MMSMLQFRCGDAPAWPRRRVVSLEVKSQVRIWVRPASAAEGTRLHWVVLYLYLSSLTSAALLIAEHMLAAFATFAVLQTDSRLIAAGIPNILEELTYLEL